MNSSNFFDAAKDFLITEGAWIIPLAALFVVVGIPSGRGFLLTPIRFLLGNRSADSLASVQTSVDDGSSTSSHLSIFERVKLKFGFSPTAIRFVEKRNACRWSMGAMSGEPAMQVVGHWYATNTSQSPIELLDTALSPKALNPHVFVKAHDRNIFGSFPLLPGITTEVSADYWIKPPIKRKKQTLTGSLVFVDNLQRTYRIRGVKFAPMVSKTTRQIALATEAVGELSSPSEKHIASVLKDEVTRYSQNSRVGGGLGSIHLRRNGHVKTAHIFQDGWTQGTGAQQEIYDGSDAIQIESENGDALVQYYNGLGTENEKQEFVDALLSRIDNSREYLGASYLIAYVLKRVGRLNEALDAVNSNLPFKPTWADRVLFRKHNEFYLLKEHRHGHSNVYAMFGGMLRWEHTAFSETELDCLEKSIKETDEHTFRIEKKIAAIRAHRLRTG